MVGDIVTLVEQARAVAARSVNTVMTTTHWLVGRRIVEQEQRGQLRADYGEATLTRLASDLTGRLGRSFSRRNLNLMRQFYLTWPVEKIWQLPIAKSDLGSTCPQASARIPQSPLAECENPVIIPEIGSPAWQAVFPLPWTAYTKLLALKSDAARAFYESEALRNGWTITQLDRQIQSLFYERTASSHNKAAMLERDADQVDSGVAPVQSAIRDPFLLEFLNLKDEYSETDVEDALIDHLADFLLELGDDFTFVARQRRMRIDDSWFRCDLVLYHRTLRCLMLIELKLGRYSYQDASQMAMYLSYARHSWMKPGENPPVGLVLCSEKGSDEARYSLDGLRDPVLAAEYKVALPDESVLVQELTRTRDELEHRKLRSQ